ncbi:hypothetical protein JTB14_037457 [Gonioctena quinquepunctata]|nr:hypothetical protein JTB14_037457 [Gonioctena quinquepunctata]
MANKEQNDNNFSENCNLTYNDPFTLSEMEKVLDSTNLSSPRPDTIPYEMLHALPQSAKETPLELGNKIWIEGIYPKQWMNIIIIPVPEPGKDPKNTKNYRQISLSNCISKVFEKMVNYRLVWYLERNELLSSFQMGFRRYRSTIDGLIQLENAIRNISAIRNHFVEIFFDLEEAYDMTWKYGILKQLQEWGLKVNLPKFIESFLFQRSSKVRVENTLSDEHTLDNGIPQGSTLSVTLSAIAINSLFKNLNPAVGQIMYVDDITIFFSSDNMNLIEKPYIKQ